MDKSAVRKRCLKILRAKKKKNTLAIDKKISLDIEYIIRKTKPKSILLYSPLNLEVNLKKLLQKYRKKLKILIPKVQEESFIMVEYRLPLEENSFKILEPKSSSFAHKNVDLIIVPVVAIGKDMQRVGFGAGMYDRFFDSLHKKPVVVFVQRIACGSKGLICDKHDIKCDYFVSSKEKIVGSYNDRYITSRWGSSSRSFSRLFRYKSSS